MVLRFDGPLYTANVRGAIRRILALDERPEGSWPDVLVLDASAVAVPSITAIDEVVQLEHELAERGTTLWVAALPPRTLAAARRTPRWRELDEAGRLHPSSLAAIRAWRAAGQRL